jgi:hypothetical protein
VSHRDIEAVLAVAGKDPIMLVSRDTAELILDDVGIHGGNRERILADDDVFDLDSLATAIRRHGDESLPSYMK